ncbi:MAG: hypothetical protein WAT68_12555, partial [Candidatus Nitrotoga sp.]
ASSAKLRRWRRNGTLSPIESDPIDFTIDFSERKRMTTFHGTSENVIAYTKGAPESVLSCCERVRMADGNKLSTGQSCCSKPNPWLPTACAYWP